MAMDFIEITKEVINVEILAAKVLSPSCGAISCFLGTTRDNFKGKKVRWLEYEAYEPMAKKELLKICDQIRHKWSVQHIVIVHRVGEVPVTETSVAIIISSPHRNDCIEAVQYGIDTLKATVPIWKKEIYEDGTYSWKENTECRVVT